MNVKHPIEKTHNFEKKVAYVLNPTGDLIYTEELMSRYFKSNIFWERIHLKKSESEAVISKIKKGYVYMWV